MKGSVPNFSHTIWDVQTGQGAAAKALRPMLRDAQTPQRAATRKCRLSDFRH